MDTAELARTLRKAIDQAPDGEIVVSIHLFGIRHETELRGVSLSRLVVEADTYPSYATEIRKGMNLAAFVRPR